MIKQIYFTLFFFAIENINKFFVSLVNIYLNEKIFLFIFNILH